MTSATQGRLPYSGLLGGCVASAAACLVVSALGGCGDCDLGRVCDGNMLIACYKPEAFGGNWAEVTPCDGACAESPDGDAQCVLSSEPSELCPAEGEVLVCDGDEVLSCFWGLEQYRLACSDATASKVCVDPDGDSAFCAYDAAPSARCGRPDGTFCSEDGGTEVRCFAGYEVARTVCGDRYVCEAAPGDAATWCAWVEQVGPTALCGETDVYATCDGDEQVTCYRGYERRRVACPAGKSCERSSPTEAGCTTLDDG